MDSVGASCYKAGINSASNVQHYETQELHSPTLAAVRRMDWRCARSVAVPGKAHQLRTL